MTTTGIDPWGRVTGQRAYETFERSRATDLLGRSMLPWAELPSADQKAWLDVEYEILERRKEDAVQMARTAASLVRCEAIKTLVQAAESPASVPPHVVSAASVLLNADDKDLAAVALDMEFVKKLEARIHPMQTLDVKPKETA